jgi:hypothetical protein
VTFGGSLYADGLKGTSGTNSSFPFGAGGGFLFILNFVFPNLLLQISFFQIYFPLITFFFPFLSL